MNKIFQTFMIVAFTCLSSFSLRSMEEKQLDFSQITEEIRNEILKHMDIESILSLLLSCKAFAIDGEKLLPENCCKYQDKTDTLKTFCNRNYVVHKVINLEKLSPQSIGKILSDETLKRYEALIIKQVELVTISFFKPKVKDKKSLAAALLVNTVTNCELCFKTLNHNIVDDRAREKYRQAKVNAAWDQAWNEEWKEAWMYALEEALNPHLWVICPLVWLVASDYIGYTVWTCVFYNCWTIVLKYIEYKSDSKDAWKEVSNTIKDNYWNLPLQDAMTAANDTVNDYVWVGILNEVSAHHYALPVMPQEIFLDHYHYMGSKLIDTDLWNLATLYKLAHISQNKFHELREKIFNAAWLELEHDDHFYETKDGIIKKHGDATWNKYKDHPHFESWKRIAHSLASGN